MMAKFLIAFLAGTLTLAAAFQPTSYRDGATAGLVSPPAPQSACDRWWAAFSNLTSAQRAVLQKDGAVFSSGYLLLSEELVKDCEVRGETSEHLSRSLSLAEAGEEQAGSPFVKRHSKDVVAVLRRLWPTLSGSKVFADGALAETKYALLAEPALDEADLVPFVSDILKAETMDNGMARVLFARPMPGSKPAIRATLRVFERIDDSSGRILALAVLQKLGDVSALPKLKELLTEGCLSTLERSCVAVLVGKVERGDELVFSDVEGLEYGDTVLPAVKVIPAEQSPCRQNPGQPPAKNRRIRATRKPPAPSPIARRQ